MWEDEWDITGDFATEPPDVNRLASLDVGRPELLWEFGLLSASLGLLATEDGCC